MDSFATSVTGTEKNVVFLLLLLTWIQHKCWQEMNGWWMECKCDVNTRYKAAATGGCKVALTLQQERPPRLLSASPRWARNEDKFSFFWRRLRCDGNFKWTRPFFLPLARWKSSSPSQPASCQGRSCIRCVVFLSLFFSSRLSSPGNRIWACVYNKSVNYLSDLPQRATSCTAQSICRAPPVRPVRSDGARSGFSASTANTPEQKSGRAENKAASLICGEWKVLNGRQSFEVFLKKKERKKERVSLTSPVCHSFSLPSPSSNCCSGWWKLGEGAEKAPCPRKYVNFFIHFFLGEICKCCGTWTYLHSGASLWRLQSYPAWYLFNVLLKWSTERGDELARWRLQNSQLFFCAEDQSVYI